MKKFVHIITFFSLLVILTSCESKAVRENRKTYIAFLESMSDAPEFLVINKEVVNDDDPIKIYFVVDFETKYAGRTLKDKVKIDFIGGKMVSFDGVRPERYEAEFLINILKN